MDKKDTRSYSVDGEKLAALTGELEKHGLKIDTTQPGGNVESGGFNVDWNVKHGVLTLTVNKHPFAEEGMFWSKVQNIVGEPLAEEKQQA